MKSLSTRLVVISAAVLSALLVVTGVWVERKIRHTIEQQELEQAEIHARTLLASLQTLMLNGSGTLARKWLDRMKGTAGIINIDVLRLDGTPAFRDLRTVNRVNAFLGEIRFSREQSNNGEDSQPSDRSFQLALQGQVAFEIQANKNLSVLLPIPGDTGCLACHGYDTAHLRGVLNLSLSTENTMNRIAQMRTDFLIIMATMIGLLAAALVWVARSTVIKPLEGLGQALARVAAGERDATVPVVRMDEIGKVAMVFNQMQEALKAGEARIRAVMDNVVDAIVMIDETGTIESVNPAAESLFGYSAEELAGLNVKILAPEPQQKLHDQYIENYLVTGRTGIIGSVREVSGKRKDGTIFPMDLGVSQMQVGKKRYFIGVARDITSRRAQTAALRHQALDDGLTDLPNRSLFYDRLDQAILINHRERRNFAVMLIDLNEFKDVNDKMGHHVGDLVLQDVAKRLAGALRESDTIARIGGDEFSVLLPGTNADFALTMADRITRSLYDPLNLQGEDFKLSASIGIALFPEHGEDASNLMQRADAAMYAAKRAGMSYTMFDPKQDHYEQQHWVQLKELKEALGRNELTLHYQPKVELLSGKIYGVEALCRWNHPRYGLLMPEEFIPLAEQTGMIKPITLWVLKSALNQWKSWQEKDWELGVAINLSVGSLQDATFIENLHAVIHEYQNCAMKVKLEITETSIMADPERATYILKRLNSIGVRLSIDDFGIGYSSLAYLKQLPVDELKIDKSFITGMSQQPESIVIVRSTIDLAHKLGLMVVAEGVESENVYRMLKDLGCDAAQGYYISRPLSGEELQEWFDHSDWEVGTS